MSSRRWTRFAPCWAIRVDQGTEFVSRNLDLWAYLHGITLDFSRLGKPTDNAFIEAFNGRFGAERLNAHTLLNLADAAEKLEAWRRDYNEDRAHGAISNKTPIEFINPGDAARPSPWLGPEKSSSGCSREWGRITDAGTQIAAENSGAGQPLYTV